MIMKTLRNSAYLLLVSMTLLFNQCQPVTKDLAPVQSKGSANSSARIDPSSCSSGLSSINATVGNYRVTFKSVAQQGSTYVWEYEIAKVGNGGGPLYLSMGCVTKDDYDFVSIADNNLNSSEEGFTHGKDCSDNEGNFLKVAGLNSAFNGSNPPTVVSLKIGLKVDVDQTAGHVSSIAVGSCDLQPMVTPGCYHLCGVVKQAQCDDLPPTVVVGATVTITNGTSSFTAVTDADGSYCFCGIPAGNYTVSVLDQTTDVTIQPASVDELLITIPAHCNACSFSQGYYFRSPVGTAASVSYWPLSIGGKSYSRIQGIAIFNARAGGYANISNCFTQVAAIKLSAALGHLTLSGALQANVTIVETYLVGLGYQLDPSNSLAFPSNTKLPKTSGGISSSAAVTAAGAISSWIEANHCTEVPF
ncbi:hypothetical protein GJR95_39380 [Spirosoma endbachense]|uniref:Carboxypeptidase regulatory-like domain-containing protein n=2 Tax=Spirosoma endbachense TaxID=2666025 RepID=A0A6P1W9Y5_9BACT|nr:hypothetical protein GJR95_39380 [Spirosoma endbachense]